MLADLPAKVGHVSFLGTAESHTDAGLLSFVRASQFSGFERVNQTPERACSWIFLELPMHVSAGPYAAFPDTRSRSLNKRSIPKNVPDCNPSIALSC